MKNIIVLDASVVVKWFSDEEFSEIALKIRDEFVNGNLIIACPDLLLYEISNALRYAKTLNEEDIKKAVESIYAMEIYIITPTVEIMQKAIEIALKNDITVYDAVYVSLAELLGCRLITADKKLVDTWRNLDFVVFLKDLFINLMSRKIVKAIKISRIMKSYLFFMKYIRRILETSQIITPKMYIAM